MIKLRVTALIALVIAVFVSVDLGLNFGFSLIPELQDGIDSHSVLQSLFEVFGDRGWSRARFFYAFQRSLWVTFAIFAVNVLLYARAEIRRKKN